MSVVLTFTPIGRPGYRVGEFRTEELARIAADKHGAPPRGMPARPALQWEPGYAYQSAVADTTNGTFVITPA